MKLSVIQYDILAVVCIGVAVRAIVSLHSYSGAEKPPMFGDYEAQRHWQEVTINMPPGNWYTNSSDNNLEYWGLDYPPLSAYQSYIMGAMAKAANESFIKLNTSHGFESPSHKSFMRSTVLMSDIFIYIPAILALGVSLDKTFNTDMILPFMFLVMLYPGQILIDNGHFQYNNTSLGLAAIAVASILTSRYYIGAFFFTLALNFKQMELYHALPFFAYLLRVCFLKTSLFSGIRRLLTIAGIVLFTFIILWLPWIHSLDSIASVVKRIFPIGRGVFEDKVSNIWCAINIVYKLRKHFSNGQMAVLCMVTTVLAVLPINTKLFISIKKTTFLYSLFNTAMAFFLFSFQVHEKSILLVALPATCLFRFKPFEMFCFLEITVFSMFPLYVKDSLVMPFFSMWLIFQISIKELYINNYFLNSKLKLSLFNKLYYISCFLRIVLALALLFAPTPEKYPYLWPLLISLYSCFHFILIFMYSLYSNFCQ